MSSGESAKLTKRTVDAIQPPETGFVRVWDKELKGFYLRVRANGRKTYELRFRIGRRLTSMVIGDHGPFTPEEARDEAKEAKRTVRRGGDPLATRKAAREALTVREVIARYLVEGPAANPNKRAASWRTDATNLHRHVEPLLGARPARELAPADLERWQKDVAGGKTARAETKREKGDDSRPPRSRSIVRGGRGVAARAMQSFSAMLGWAARPDVGILTENPARKVAKYTARKMQSFLSPQEALRLWTAIDALEAGIEPPAPTGSDPGADDEKRVDPKRAAKIVKLSPATLHTYRTKGGGPLFEKHPRTGRISYRVADLHNWSRDTRRARKAVERIEPGEADVVRLLALTGARLSEIKDMRWHEIDWTRAMVVIRADRHKSGALTGDERIIHLPDAALAILRQRKAKVAERRRQRSEKVVTLVPADSARLNAPPFVFPRADGKASIGPPKTAWPKVRKAANLPGLRLHDLRHSFASFMLANGLPLAFVGKALGHRKAATTERYAHLRPDAAAEGARNVASVFTTPASER